MSNRYYCPNCKTEVIGEMPAKNGTKCHYCYTQMLLIPTYETIAQWEARHGIPYPDDGPVWVRGLKCVDHAMKYEFRGEFHLTQYGNRKCDAKVLQMLIGGPDKPGEDYQG